MKIGIILMNRDRPELTDAVYNQVLPMAPTVDKKVVVVEAGSKQPGGCSKHQTHWFRDRSYRGRYHAFARGLDFLHRDHGKDFDYYWFLCNDITFPGGQDALAELIDCMEDDPQMGLIGPSESNQDWYPGAASQADTRWHKAATVHGLAHLIRGSVIRDIGYLNHRFHYSQGAGTEYAYLLNRAEWFLAYADRCSIEHAGGSTYGKVVPVSRHEYQRRANRFATRYLAKNYGPNWDKVFSKALPDGLDGSNFTWQKEVWSQKLPKDRSDVWFWQAGRWVQRKLGLYKKPTIPDNVTDALANLRRTGVCPPPTHEIDLSSIDIQTSPPFEDPFDQAVYEAASSLQPVGRIAFDLDDTLLLNSRALRDIWLPAPGTDKNGRELVECALLPGAIALLAGLRDAGNELALITTSSRRRVAHLLGRLPEFAAFFVRSNAVAAQDSPLIINAEEIANAQHQNSALRPAPDTIQLTQKTPDLAETIFGGGGYNLIVDDSDEVAAVLEQCGARDALIPVKTMTLDATTALDIVRSIARSTGQSSSFDSPPPSKESPLRLQDPYFLADLCCGHSLLTGQDFQEPTA